MDAIEEVRNRLEIEDVIGEYVTLKRSGRNYKALSPFTSEKTPSFIVSPDKQIWKDFSSGRGGSVFDFIMAVEGLDFKEALELLANKAGVNLEDYQSNNRKSKVDKDKLYQILEVSTKFYQAQLKVNKFVLDYLFQQRHYSKDTIIKWRLGYSPNNGDALISFLNKQGFSSQEIKLAGLSSQNYRGKLQDMFRGRLMIPLSDHSGRVIGFTARILEVNNQVPKYINTAQTILYDKSHHVFGLNNAKDSIRKSNFAVLVEGNLDVIASHQAGVYQAVATAGTALTESQIKSIARLTNDIRLCFDSDRAGLTASERAILLSSKQGIDLSVISLPSGKDPDELVKQDPKLWQQAVNDNVYALDWLIKRYISQIDINTAKGKREFTSKLMPTLSRLSDPVEQDHYLSQIAKLISVDKSALLNKMQGETKLVNAPKKVIKTKDYQPKAIDLEYLKLEDRFLCLMLSKKTLRQLLNHIITEDMLVSDNAKQLFKYLKNHPDFDYQSNNSLQKLADYVKIEVLLYEELYQGLDMNDLHEEASRLEADLLKKYVKQQKQSLKLKLSQQSSLEVLRALQENDKQLNDLLK